MTRRRLRRIIVAVITLYASALVSGLTLRLVYPAPDSIVYATYKDMMPFMIAIPAAYLAYCFQQRTHYLLSLRALWSRLVAAVSAAVVYTHVPEPTQDLYTATLKELGVAIEEVRGVFRNVSRKGYPDGWYPFEPVKQIYKEIRDLGFGDAVTADEQYRARKRIAALWKHNRSRFLAEFDRDTPTFHATEKDTVLHAVCKRRAFETSGAAGPIPGGDARSGTA